MLSVRLASLLGQPDVSEFLRGVVARGRYANAYLFHGAAGVGKGTAALAFARAMLCERVPGAAPAAAEPSLFGAAPEALKSGNDACGECRGCRMSGTLQHPDLKLLFPLSGEEKTLEGTVIDTFEKLRADPLHVFQYEKAASIRISQTRELLAELGYRPHTASRRVVVVRDCDRMREDQFSALLKRVEEPGESTVWVLTTARLSRVPVTIRSRCQRVRFAPLFESLVRDVLREHAGIEDEAKLRMLAALSAGSLARALAMRDVEPGLLEQRDAALALLTPALARKPEALWSAVQKLTGFGKSGRERLRQTLEFHQLLLRDVLRLRYGAPAESLVNRDLLAELRALSHGLDASEIRRRLLVLEEALRGIDGNVSADLTLFSTLSRVGGDRMGEGAWPAHATARWDV